MTRRLAPGVLVALVLSACGADPAADEPGEAADAAPEAEDPAAPDPDAEQTGEASAQLTVAASDLGELVVDSEGMTLYLFDLDENGESTCYEECAAAWPPLEGPAEAGTGIDASLIGTTERADGTVQATYAGWPLYSFAGDAASGDVTGQGVNDVWWVIAPDGSRVTGSEDPGGGGYGY